MKQVAEQTGIPIKQLKIIKVMYPEGFNRELVKVELVKAYYEKHKELLAKKESESIDTLKKEKLANDIILQNFEIAKQNKQMVKTEDQRQWLKDFGVTLNMLHKSKILNEYPDKFDRVEKSQRPDLWKQLYNDLVSAIHGNYEQWSKVNDS